MLRPGHVLVLAVIALLSFGVVMVNSAGLSVTSETKITLEHVMLGRQTILALFAVAAMTIAAFIPVRSLYEARGLRSPLPWLILVSIVLLLAVHVPGIGHAAKGSARWLNLGFVKFQPSEVAKWSMPILLAAYAAARPGSMSKLFTGFLPPMLLTAVFCALIAVEDLGTAVLIGLVSVMVLLAAGCRVRYAVALIPVGVAAFVYAVIHSPYRIDRLKAFLEPYADPQGIGYHMIQSMAAVSGGGLAGHGLGNSLQKFGYLPEDTTDFIFAIICEELGFAGAAVVVCLYAALLFCGFSILRKTTNPFERLVGLGILLTIGLQAIINMAVVTGVAPTKGIALPLLSAGGTGWVLTAFSVGLLVSLDREQARRASHAEELGLEPIEPDLPAALPLATRISVPS